MIGVFGYLTWRSARNRLSRQILHLRSPRYLIALLLGLAYLWFMVIEQRTSPAAGEMPDQQVLRLVGALALMGAVAWGWVFGVERRVLAFTPAEVTFLFSGPVSRSGLIQFKLLRSQLLILFNALLWTLILSHERFGVSSWIRVISLWVLLTTLSFHRLGASFVRSSLAQHGRLGLQHRVVSLVVLGFVVIAFAWSLAETLPGVLAARGTGLQPLLKAAVHAAEHPLANAVLYPFRLMIQPLTARTLAEWLRALWPAVILLVLHYVWVIRSDSAFEEAAAEVSLKHAQSLSRHQRSAGRPISSLRPTGALFSLSASGWPAGAILWKNLVAATRTRRVRNTGLMFCGAAALITALSFYREGSLAELAGWLLLTWAGLMIVTGPQYVRNDLRSDLLKLDMLRSYPLKGSSVVLAEAAASTLVLTILQFSLLILTYLAFLGNSSMVPDREERTLLLLIVLVCLPAVNLLGMLIQNGAALLFPAWVRLGSGRTAGVEALGQNILMMIAFVAVLSLTLLLPLALGAGGFLLLRSWMEDWALAPALALVLLTIGLESALGVDWLGRVFEHTDPAAAGISR
jgi:hypothetical protein